MKTAQQIIQSLASFNEAGKMFGDKKAYLDMLRKALGSDADLINKHRSFVDKSFDLDVNVQELKSSLMKKKGEKNESVDVDYEFKKLFPDFAIQQIGKSIIGSLRSSKSKDYFPSGTRVEVLPLGGSSSIVVGQVHYKSVKDFQDNGVKEIRSNILADGTFEDGLKHKEIVQFVNYAISGMLSQPVDVPHYMPKEFYRD